MADNVVTQSAVPSTVPSGTKIAARSVSYSGDADELIAPVGLVTFAGSDDAKTATDVTSSNPLPVVVTGDVDVASVPAPLSTTGGGTEATALRVTLASDSTGVVSVDDNGGSLTVDNGGTFAVQAAQSGAWNVGTVTTVTAVSDAQVQGKAAHDAAVNGNPVLIGAEFDDTTPDAVDEGDVGRLRISSNRNLHTTIRDGLGGEFGVQVYSNNMLSVSLDNVLLDGGGGQRVSNTGTFAVQVQDGVGNALTSKAPGSERALSVAIVDGSGNQVTSFGGSGGTSATDDSVFTPASGSGTPIMGFADETAPDAVDEGDVGVVRMTLTRALHVNLRDAAGAEVAVGGGTQYTEDAAAAANPVATALNLIRDDARAGSLTTADGDNVAARGTNAGELYVKHVDAIPVTDNAGSLTVDGSVTANAGTNLNTSALALESGGNLAGAATSLAILDDWDETDRAKVNVIAGQAGVAGGSGVVGATTQRVVLATDVGLPAGANALGSVSVTGTVTVGSHAVTNSGTFAVQVSSALPAGTNNIGDVDVLSVVPGSAATNLGKAEDAVHASGDVGVMALAVRSDALVASSGTSGDYEPLHTDSVGAQWVRESGAIADDSAFVVATSRVQPIGFLADETATDSLDEGDAGAARMTLDRKQIVTPYAHAGAGGAAPYKNLDVDETEDEIKATPGKVFWIHVINLHTAKLFIKFYNATAANVTVGTTTPVLSFPVPTMGDTNGAGFAIHFGDMGVQFDTAITVAATTGVLDNDTGAIPSANLVILNAGFL